MNKKYRIVYCTPSLYIPGGVERVLTTKANYFAEVLNYDVYIVLTDGKDKTPYYPLSPKIHIINQDINFDELWGMSFIRKVFVYLFKQHIYKRKLSKTLLELKPDFTVSLLRREINFITEIKDGSIKIGELHVNKHNYRNFEAGETNIFKKAFSKIWMKDLSVQLKKLDRLIVLTNEDKDNWEELNNVAVINNPLPYQHDMKSLLDEKKVIAVGRYTYQKGFDLLLKAWSKVVEKHNDWNLYIYGAGDKSEYIELSDKLGISGNCHLEDAVQDINAKYTDSSIFAFSSRFEGFGMVLIEAMACGLPCVSFACPCGPREIIQNGRNGFLIDNYNIDLFAEKLNFLIENDDVRHSMGDNAIMSSARYDIDQIGLQWKSLFDELYNSKQ